MSIDNQIVNSESKKRWIEMVQKQLVRENPSALPNAGVDGKYGPETRDWVQRFQERKGLQIDGTAGPETLGRLRSDIVQRPNTSGKGVEILQEDLQFFYIQQTAIDGEYGPGTTQGVRDFQFLNNLVVDGSAGPNTLKKMDELITTILLQRGDSGSLVRRIQNQLNDQDSVDISVDIDGEFGPGTESAVKEFQETLDQTADGIVGPVTMNLLDLEADHPVAPDEFVQFMDDVGVNTVATEVTDTNDFLSELESHSAVQSVVPDGSIEDLLVIEYSLNSQTVFLASFSIEDEQTTSVYAKFTSDKELDTVVVMSINGDLYENDATLTSYDVEGNIIEDSTQSYLEFTNDSLEVQKEISQALREYSETMQIYVEFEDFICSARKVLIMEMFCVGAPWALGLFPVLGKIAGVALGIACNVVIAPYVDELLEEECG